MKRILLALSLVIVLLLVGCTTAAEPEQPGVLEPGTRGLPPTGESPTSKITYEGNRTILAPDIGFGVNSRAVFEGVYPGWSGTIPITIVNGRDRDRLFVISVVSPTNPLEGYEAFPRQYLYWFTISQPTVTVLKGGSFQVPITLTMPKDLDCRGKKFEVRILVEDTTQTGLVQIAVESRWFIIIAD